MTHYLATRLLPNTFFQSTIGFDRLVDELSTLMDQKPSTYPPHNVRQISDTTYEIELAVAGFTREQLEVYTEQSRLVIRGAHAHDRDTESTYVHRGLALRSFEKVIPIAETIVVRSAVLEHGMLRITVENVVPDTASRTRIAIQ